jgi:chromosome segregation ATPase
LEINEHINSINTKLQQLLKQYDTLLKENSRQQQRIASLLEEQKLAKEQLEDFHQQNLILKASVTTMEQKDKKELEQRINQYVKNIDQCISLLSK